MEPMERLALSGLQAVHNVDQALQNLGLISYMAAKQNIPESVKPRGNGKIKIVRAKKRKSPKGGYWSKMTKEERRVEMTRRQAVRRLKRLHQENESPIIPVAD